jgi:hypothetical protein
MTFSLIHDEPSGVHGCYLRAWSSTMYSHCAYEEVMRKLVNGLRFLGTWSDDWHVPTNQRNLPGSPAPRRGTVAGAFRPSCRTGGRAGNARTG